MKDLMLGGAAKTIGVSQDTLRRWDRAGRPNTQRDERNRRLVPVEEARRSSARRVRHESGARTSDRNRSRGVVWSGEVDGVMAPVELKARTFLVTAAVNRDSVEELGLAQGVEATATEHW